MLKKWFGVIISYLRRVIYVQWLTFMKWISFVHSWPLILDKQSPRLIYWSIYYTQVAGSPISVMYGAILYSCCDCYGSLGRRMLSELPLGFSYCIHIPSSRSQNRFINSILVLQYFELWHTFVPWKLLDEVVCWIKAVSLMPFTDRLKFTRQRTKYSNMLFMNFQLRD